MPLGQHLTESPKLADTFLVLRIIQPGSQYDNPDGQLLPLQVILAFPPLFIPISDVKGLSGQLLDVEQFFNPSRAMT